MPLGGPGGIGGGGQAATSTINWSDNPPISKNGQIPTHYISGQDGTDGCGGGGGGGQAWKKNAYLHDATLVNLGDSYGNPIFQDPNTGDIYVPELSSGALVFAGNDLFYGTPLYFYDDQTNPGTTVVLDLSGNVYVVTNNFSGNYDDIEIETDRSGNTVFDGNGNPQFIDNNTGAIFVEQYDSGNNPIVANDYYGSFQGIEFQDSNNPPDVIYENANAPGYFNNLQSGYVDIASFNPAQSQLIDPSADSLDKPGKGGNGIVAIRFQLSGANYGSGYNPAFSVPKLLQTWPTNSHQLTPIQLKQQSGSAYVCLQVANPTNTAAPYGSSTALNFSLGGQQSSEVEESGTASSLASYLRNLDIRRTDQDFLIRDKDAWVRDGKVYVLVRLSGSDDVSMDSCANSSTDLPLGGMPLQAVITLNRMPATLSKRSAVVLKSGSK